MNSKALMLIAVGLLTTPAIAAKPADPGGFGADRAAVIHGMIDGTSPYSTGAPGASEWGKIASDRAGTNGDVNNDYKVQHGDLPDGVTPGN